jgi:hypothetical protein
MMRNMYQQQLIDFYMKQCNNLNSSRTLYPNQYVNVLENTNNTGFMRLNIINYSDKTPVTNATITIYVTDGQQRDIPVMHLITTINPIRIELPMANELGTQIAGPEYNFSTYNLRVDAFGYYARNIYNIRLFPNTTTDFEIDLVPTSYLEAQPLIEERFDIPPHLRDEPN